MRRRLFLVALGATALGGLLALQALARDGQYRQLLAEGNTAIANRQPFLAIEALSGALVLRPDSMVAHLRRAEAYRLRGDLDEAARDLRRAASLDPSAVRPLDELADVLAARQRFRRAAETLEARLRIDERSPEAIYKLALARFSAGDTQAALAALARARPLGEMLPQAAYLEALCLRQLGRLDEAVAALNDALARAPGLSAAREELASVYASLGRPHDEIEQLHLLAGLEPEQVVHQRALSRAHARAGDIQAAVSTLTRALDRTPDDNALYGALGQVWLDAARTTTDPVALAQALRALERASATTTAPSDVLTSYGRALALDGQFQRAEQALRRALERFPVEPTAFLEYADVAARVNRPAEARQALVSYGTLVDDDRSLAVRAVRVASLSLDLGEPAVADTWLARAETAQPAPEVHVQIARLRARVATLVRNGRLVRSAPPDLRALTSVP